MAAVLLGQVIKLGTSLPERDHPNIQGEKMMKLVPVVVRPRRDDGPHRQPIHEKDPHLPHPRPALGQQQGQ